MGRGGAAFFLRCVLYIARARSFPAARSGLLAESRLRPSAAKLGSALASARSTVSWGAGADWRLLRSSRFLSGQLGGRAGVAARGALRRASQFHKAPAAARARRVAVE